MTVKSDGNTATHLANSLDAAVSACLVSSQDFSPQSSLSVESAYGYVSSSSVSLCEVSKLIGYHDATLLRSAAQLFTDTDAALSTDILQSLH
ncbi:MAG: hypothetical protein FWE41_00795 [Coriobacteriia bacterium]|nr:hypothetical protein [Coriobacteriia bacterium]MCL2750520.1 hypothetical protein [Coriobacteriia bacterium]